jgi:ferrochelatase
VGTHPAFVAAVRDLIEERLDHGRPRRAIGRYGPSHDVCPASCCLPGTGRASPWDDPEVPSRARSSSPPAPGRGR